MLSIYLFQQEAEDGDSIGLDELLGLRAVLDHIRQQVDLRRSVRGILICGTKRKTKKKRTGWYTLQKGRWIGRDGRLVRVRLVRDVQLPEEREQQTYAARGINRLNTRDHV